MNDFNNFNFLSNFHHIKYKFKCFNTILYMAYPKNFILILLIKQPKLLKF